MKRIHWPTVLSAVALAVAAASLLLRSRDRLAEYDRDAAANEVRRVYREAQGADDPRKADAITETIDGVRIRSLGAKLSGSSVHYGQHGSTFAAGSDRKAVADLTTRVAVLEEGRKLAGRN